jgi:hypothetical protein
MVLPPPISLLKKKIYKKGKESSHFLQMAKWGILPSIKKIDLSLRRKIKRSVWY